MSKYFQPLPLGQSIFVVALVVGTVWAINNLAPATVKDTVNGVKKG